MRAEGVFCIKKNLRTHIFFEFGENLQTQVQNLQTHFFRKKNRNLKNTHTQRLSLENSPNSRVEFGDFPELRFKRNKIPNTCFFFTNQNEFGEFSKLKCWVWRILQTQIQKNFFLSLENSPNSRVEFGEFCKLKCWVCRILQTQNQKKKISDFFLKMHLENSQEFL